MDWLTAPLGYGFLQTALLAAALVGATCAVLGTYVILRRMALVGDALAHTTLPGLVVAYLNGWSLFGGALVAGLLTAVGIGWLSRREELHEDTAIGVAFTGMFALGILLLTAARSYRDLAQMLFGNVLGVTRTDLLLIGGVAAIVLGTLFLLHKELELVSFDPLHAETIGLSPDRLRYLVLGLLALTVVVGIQVVGVVLTTALLVTPPAAAALLTKRLPTMMAVAVAVAVGSAVVGLYASYYWSVSSGAAIVLACVGYFGLAWTARAVRDRAAARRTSSGSMPGLAPTRGRVEHERLSSER